MLPVAGTLSGATAMRVPPLTDLVECDNLNAMKGRENKQKRLKTTEQGRDEAY